jgi:hypothetical protein
VTGNWRQVGLPTASCPPATGGLFIRAKSKGRRESAQEMPVKAMKRPGTKRGKTENHQNRYTPPMRRKAHSRHPAHCNRPISTPTPTPHLALPTPDSWPDCHLASTNPDTRPPPPHTTPHTGQPTSDMTPHHINTTPPATPHDLMPSTSHMRTLTPKNTSEKSAQKTPLVNPNLPHLQAETHNLAHIKSRTYSRSIYSRTPFPLRFRATIFPTSRPHAASTR